MLISLSTLLATLSSIFRSRAALELGNLALRHRIGVLQRSVRKRPEIDLKRPPVVDLAVPLLARLAPGAGHRQARNGHPSHFSPPSVQLKSEINGAFPCKRHQKQHLEFCTTLLRTRRPGVRVFPGAPLQTVYWNGFVIEPLEAVCFPNESYMCSTHPFSVYAWTNL